MEEGGTGGRGEKRRGGEKTGGKARGWLPLPKAASHGSAYMSNPRRAETPVASTMNIGLLIIAYHIRIVCCGALGVMGYGRGVLKLFCAPH